MYFLSAPNEGSQQAGLRGFSLGQFADEDQTSRDAILKALQLNPVGGYVRGSAARKQLDDAINSVPVCSALQLAQQLLNGQGSLERLFRYRLDPATQQTLLKILAEKAKVCQQQQKDILRRKEEDARTMQEMLQQMCVTLRKEEPLIQELCRRTGEDSEQCRKFRAGVLESREQLRRQRFPCP